ncbi:MAG TPA: dihydrodipicolinate synthase family protein, partial [Bacteroidota bacterium]|nr:dihydrodipicolinate synthase family protein [Bacteroidota bacterium]
ISVNAIRRLSRHPNIIGMKDSRGDAAQLKAFASAVPKRFTVIVGSASILYNAWEMGVRAAILAPANCSPEECIAVARLFEEGALAGAKALAENLLPVNKAVTDTFGIAGMKYAATLMGYEGGFVRSPLRELTRSEQKSVEKILKTAGML